MFQLSAHTMTLPWRPKNPKINYLLATTYPMRRCLVTVNLYNFLGATFDRFNRVTLDYIIHENYIIYA